MTTAKPSPHRPFKKDDDTADEIAGDVLKSEADAKANSASQNTQGGSIDADSLKNDQQTDEQQQIANDCAGCFTNTQIHSAPGEYSVDKALAFTGDVNKQNKK